jgi:hypothetical protein
MIKKIGPVKLILIFLGVAVLILWQMLLPGYVLTLDMIFTPEIRAEVPPGGFFNFLPISWVLYCLNIFLPGWIIQKIILLALFFSLGYLSFKFLPVGQDKKVRFFTALIYTANPFVYARFLAGQWGLLLAYSFLPVFIHLLFKFTERPDFKSAVKFFGILFLISLFSVHFLIMAALAAAFWLVCRLIKYFIKREFLVLRMTLKNLFFAGLIFLAASSYWMIPAAMRDKPIEQGFDARHWQAYEASNHGNIGTTLNVLSLNGFWGEREVWGKYFVWPQDYKTFWLSFLAVIVSVLIGLVSGLGSKSLRGETIFFAILGLLGFIFATGLGETIFRPINLWFYEHIFFWSGFRDSQKFSGLLALSYAVFAGLGLAFVQEILKSKAWINYFASLVMVVPILFGFLLLGGFQKQLRPVWYPEVWQEAKKIVQNDGASRVLFLPWHGYFSLQFNNKLITANPAKRFFGEKTVASRSVETGEVYDQEQDPGYRQLDQVVTGKVSLSPDRVIDFFRGQNIKYIVYAQDLVDADNLKYEFLWSEKLEKIIEDERMVMYKVKN